VPELVFGHLLSGSSFDDNVKKVTGGRNGYGAKLTNIFSTKMTIETADSKSGKSYKQTFTNNMKKIGEPKIEDFSKDALDYTCVAFEPDFKRFGIKGLDDDMLGLLYKRVYDIAGVTSKGVNVHLNGKKIKDISCFKTYIDLYMKSINEDNGTEAPYFYESPHTRWEVGVSSSDGQFQQVSYVNSICTVRGGNHVEYIANQIVSKIHEQVKKKNKDLKNIKPFQIKVRITSFNITELIKIIRECTNRKSCF
jgi:DNA topoisomerase-2